MCVCVCACFKDSAGKRRFGSKEVDRSLYGKRAFASKNPLLSPIFESHLTSSGGITPANSSGTSTGTTSQLRLLAACDISTIKGKNIVYHAYRKVTTGIGRGSNHLSLLDGYWKCHHGYESGSKLLPAFPLFIIHRRICAKAVKTAAVSLLLMGGN